MSNLAIESLTLKRQQLVEEKEKAIEQFDAQIVELDEAIEVISGRKAKDVIAEISYDDTHPDYIKSSIEN